MHLWTLIWLIIVGFFVGLIARWVVPGAVRGGIIVDIVVGIVGSIIGGWIYRAFGHGPLTGLWAFVYAIIGAIVLLLVVRAFTGRRSAV